MKSVKMIITFTNRVMKCKSSEMYFFNISSINYYFLILEITIYIFLATDTVKIPQSSCNCSIFSKPAFFTN